MRRFFPLVLPIFTIAACASSNTDPVAKYGDVDSSEFMRVSGDFTVCTGTVLALDDDLDGFAIVAETSDIFANNSAGYADYMCVDSSVTGYPKHYIVIASAADVGLDCNDAAATINPVATEVCDGVDNNCTGGIDETGGSTTFYADTDSDTYGDLTVTSTACSMPVGYVVDHTDCNDGNAGINPGATEICDALDVDEDCDSLADDADSSATGLSTWYEDVDGDGYGDLAVTDAACDRPVGYVADGTDCNDAVSGINPGATEVSFDGADNNCDGLKNATAIAYLCAEPVTDWYTTPWQLRIRDGTADPDGTATATWASPGANQGTGKLCSWQTVIDGDTEFFNAPFDVDGDGTYGELYVDGDGAWGLMLDAVLLDPASYTADGYAITVTSTCWDGTFTCTTGGMDGRWLVNTK